MRLLAGVCGMTCSVQVQNQTVLAGPFRHGLDRCVANGQVDHNDDTSQFLGELGALVHVFHGCGSDVQVMAFDFTSFSTRFVDGLHTIEEAVAPAHEGLRVDIFVILHKVQAAAQGLIDDTTVVTCRKTKLGLCRSPKQGATILIQVLALHDDTMGRPLKGLHIVRRNAHILQAQALQRLEAKNVANDARGQVRDRPLLEQVQIVGNVCYVLICTGNWNDLIGFGLVILIRGQTIGPNDGPGGGGRFTGNSRRSFNRVNALLRYKTKRTKDICVFRFIVRFPVAHLCIGNYA